MKFLKLKIIWTLFSDYTSKVPEDVRKANEEKLEGSEAEVVRLAEAVQALKAMDNWAKLFITFEIWLFEA